MKGKQMLWQAWTCDERFGKGEMGGGLKTSHQCKDHLLAISIVRIRCKSVMVNIVLTSTTTDAFT